MLSDSGKRFSKYPGDLGQPDYESLMGEADERHMDMAP